MWILVLFLYVVVLNVSNTWQQVSVESEDPKCGLKIIDILYIGIVYNMEMFGEFKKQREIIGDKKRSQRDFR